MKVVFYIYIYIILLTDFLLKAALNANHKKIISVFLPIFIFLPLLSKADDILIMDVYKDKNMKEIICLKAENDANTYGSNPEIDFLLGFFTGPVALIYTINQEYEISKKTAVLSINYRYFENETYRKCYSKKVKQNKLKLILLGWFTSFLIVLIVFVLIRISDSSSNNKTQSK